MRADEADARVLRREEREHVTVAITVNIGDARVFEPQRRARAPRVRRRGLAERGRLPRELRRIARAADVVSCRAAVPREGKPARASSSRATSTSCTPSPSTSSARR